MIRGPVFNEYRAFFYDTWGIGSSIHLNFTLELSSSTQHDNDKGK